MSSTDGPVRSKAIGAGIGIGVGIGAGWGVDDGDEYGWRDLNRACIRQEGGPMCWESVSLSTGELLTRNLD